VRAARLVSLLLTLQTRGQLTATELADRLEVSVRTVHRDVGSLAASGVPVEAVRGPAGGYRLAGGYRTRLTGLTADEAEALFAAGVPGPAAELGLGGELAAARLPVLANAVWRGRRLALRYREGARVVRRTVDPLGLVLKGGAWYLVARRSVGMRVYRVSRVVSARALDEQLERPAGFELAPFWEEWSRAFEESRPRVEVVARVSEEVRRHLPRERRVEADGRIVLPFQDLGEAYRELLRFGADVEVLEPPELRERIAGTAREVAAMYGH
jgi:predicted DNA-binding transcriptional regulator YafY